MTSKTISYATCKLFSILFTLVISSLSWATGNLENHTIEVPLEKCVYLLDRTVQSNSLLESLGAASGKIKKALTEQPDPKFLDISAEREIKWKGTLGLKAFDKFLPKASGLGFLRTPSVNKESPWVAMRISPETGGFLNLSVNWRGKDTNTTLYFNKPIPTSADKVSNNYLIGKDVEFVALDMHGGGTPSAESGNGSSKGSFYVKRGIAFISIDLPGHGKGTRVPMDGLDDILDYYMTILNKVVHPEVRVFLSGHSWGGEISIYGHQNSRDPRFSRIVGYIPQSPPGDLSLGGTKEQKVALEEALEKRLLSDPAMQDRIADSDYEFLSNIVRSGKVNPVASWYTIATQMDYSFEVQPKDHRSHLKPALVIMGKSDGLVYVGREEAFDHYMEKMVQKGRFVVMGKGSTFKGDEIDTGHQVFDKEIVLGKLLEELDIDYGDLGPNADPVHSKVYEANYRSLLFMGEVAGKHFERVSYDGDQGAFSALYKMFLLYGNNFAFREYLTNAVEYVRRPLANATTLQYSRREVGKAVESAQKLMDERDRQLPRLVQEKMKEYDKRFNVVGGKVSAEKEAKAKYSVEREQELNLFLSNVEKAEAEFVAEYKPEEYLKKIQTLEDEVATKRTLFQSRREKKVVPNQIEAPEWYKEDVFAYTKKVMRFDEANKQLAGLKKRNQREPFAKYDETVSSILKSLSIGDASEIAKVIENLVPTINGLPIYEEKERKKLIENTFQQLKALEKLKRSLFTAASSKVVRENVEFPEGVKSVSEAKWELRIDHSQERKDQLSEYVGGYEAEELRVKSALENDFDRRIDEIEYPEEMHGYEVAEARLSQIDNQLTDSYVPQGAKRDHYSGMVKAITIVQNRFDNVNRQLDRVTEHISGIKKKRDKLLRAISEVYDRVAKDPFSDELPASYVEKANEAEEALMVWIEENRKLSDMQSSHLLQAHQLGKTSGWAMANPPENVQSFYQGFSGAREGYYIAIEATRQEWIRLVLNGGFKEVSIDGAIGVQAKLIKLLGEEYQSANTIDENSVEGKLAKLEQEQDNLRRLRGQTKIELSEKKMTYLAQLRDDPHAEAFYEVVRVPIGELLNQDFSKFWEEINHGPQSKAQKHALMTLMSTWESMWVEVLKEGDHVHPDWYPIKSQYK